MELTPDEAAIVSLKAYIEKLEAESAEKDEIIAELQAAIDAQDHSSLDIPTWPSVKHDGTTYEVRARKFKLKGDPKTYELTDLKDPELVAKLVATRAGYLVPQN